MVWNLLTRKSFVVSIVWPKIFVFVTIGSTIIGLVAHACDSMVHLETNYPPMELKFGSNNLPYMTLPDNEIISSSATQVLQELKTDFKVIRELSHKYQQQLVKDRDKFLITPLNIE
jgi:hypothetical protein